MTRNELKYRMMQAGFAASQAATDDAKTNAERANSRLREVRASFPEPQGPMNLTPDAVKFDPVYRKALAECLQANDAARLYTGCLLATFKQQARAETRRRINERRALQLASA